jgi:hypothetical protein
MVNNKSLTSIFVAVLGILATTITISTLLESFSANAQLTPSDQTNNDIVLLSQRYNNEEFSDKIVGEVLNNGTSTAEFVEITASFYDSNGLIVGTESTYADPSTIEPGNKSPFEIFITSDAVESDAENYDFILQWRDIDGNDKSVRVLGDSSGTDTSENNRDNNNNDNEEDDNDN